MVVPPMIDVSDAMVTPEAAKTGIQETVEDAKQESVMMYYSVGGNVHEWASLGTEDDDAQHDLYKTKMQSEAEQ